MYRLRLILLLIACTPGLIACTPSETPDVGSAAPPFQLRALSGGEITLDSLKGKVVLINFWATWCGPCRTEMPSMEALYRSHKKEDFEILAISMDTDSEGSVRSFVQEFGFRFPILLDQRLAVSQAYHVRVLPTSFLIDRNGMLRDQILGARDWNDPDARLIISGLIREKRADAS